MRIHADHPPSLELRRAYQPYRKKPYVARWYESASSSAKVSDGKLRQRNKFFASAAARDEFIHQLDHLDPYLRVTSMGVGKESFAIRPAK
jgi:hypothetical protein